MFAISKNTMKIIINTNIVKRGTKEGAKKALIPLYNSGNNPVAVSGFVGSSSSTLTNKNGTSKSWLGQSSEQKLEEDTDDSRPSQTPFPQIVQSAGQLVVFSPELQIPFPQVICKQSAGQVIKDSSAEQNVSPQSPNWKQS